MSTIFHWRNHGLALAQSLANESRYADAFRLVRKLIPCETANDDHTVAVYLLAAQCALQMRDFMAARRYARTGLRLERRHAGLWSILGQALAEDPMGSRTKAAKAYLNAYRCHRQDSLSLANAGRWLVQTNQVKRGLQALKTAIRHGASDAQTVTVVVEGWLAAGKPKLAIRHLKRLRFRVDVSALLAKAQLADALQHQASPLTRTVIPFVRVAPGTTVNAGEGVVRMDTGGTRPRPHILALRVRG
jgi:Tfp pilus assembly protein PilF